MVCDHVSCALRGYGPDFRKSGPFASLRSVQGAAPLAPLRGYPCTLVGKIHPLCVCNFPTRPKPNTVPLTVYRTRPADGLFIFKILNQRRSTP